MMTSPETGTAPRSRNLKQLVLILLLSFIGLVDGYADRIYIMNSPGYNTAEPQLISAIAANGHTIVVNSTTFSSLPVGFTSTCVDSINGYDYLCFFGVTSFQALTPQILAFINVGGKVFYQYEVTCCTNASASVAAILSGLTGLAITPNANGYVGFSGSSSFPGWTGTNVACCPVTFLGNAYKGLDGLPLSNQLLATSNLNGSTPSITVSPNFGFIFTTTDFVGTANQGAIIGIGDVNIWYDGGEPFNNGGSNPINTSIVDFIFPGPGSSCYLLPPGCLTTYSGQAPNVSLGPDTTLCIGDSLILNATVPGATYLWQNNSTGATFTVTQPGTYFVEVNTVCGFGTDTITVGFNPAPIITLGNDTTICQGQSVTLNGDPVLPNLWSNGSTATSITVSAPGIYWVQVNNGQCSATDSINVTINQYPLVNLGNDTTICQGQSITLTSAPATSYLWSNGSTASSITVSTSGTYWVQSSNGFCAAGDTITVTVNLFPIISLGNDTTICQGQTVTLNGDPLAANLWSNGSTASSITVSTPGTYWLQSSNGQCASTDTVSVVVNQYPVINLGNDTTICLGQSIILNGDPSASNLWSNGSTATSITVSTTGNYWLQASNGQCSTGDTITVTVNQNPVINLGSDTTLCIGQVITLNGDPVLSNLWSNGSTGASINVTASGNYWVQVSDGTCSSADSININFIAPPAVALGNDTSICEGQSITLNSDPTASNVWSDGTTAASITVSTTGTYWVQASNGVCFRTDSIVITVNQYPDLELGSDTTICQGQTITITGDPATSYLWSTGSDSSAITVSTPGTYWVIAGNGQCSRSDSLTVNFNICETIIEMPNVFTPNSDGLNDNFIPIKYVGIESATLIIFNRWGEQIYETKLVEQGWNGMNKGNICTDGTYFWVVRYTTILNDAKEINGFLTLIK